MPYLLVLLVAAAVGAAAFRATLRGTAAHTAASRRPPVGVPVPATGQSYVTVTDVHATWESRLTGALGLVIAIVVGAVALALGTYLGIAFVVRLVNRSVG
jgi:mRNA-degrading endonuclease toxin of MazEF toxin-antitoxin module